MSNDAFARLVAEEVKNKVTQQQIDYLNMPDNWGRWHRALLALDSNLEGQLVRLEDDKQRDSQRYERLGEDGLRLLAEAIATYDDRIKKIERFKFHVQNKIDYVTQKIALGVNSHTTEDVSQSEALLRNGIQRHMDLLQEYDMEPTDIDKALWALLDGKWLFDSIEIDD
jgi:predicted HNH restriction endonuclease